MWGREEAEAAGLEPLEQPFEHHVRETLTQKEGDLQEGEVAEEEEEEEGLPLLQHVRPPLAVRRSLRSSLKGGKAL